MTNALEIRGLGHQFGSLVALSDVTLEIEQGTIFGLLGPSGSGKTTLIRIIAGALRQTSGEINVLGADHQSRSIVARIGYMTQSAALYPELSLRENLEFFGALYGIDRHRLGQRIHETVETVDLTERLDDQITTFSGGMVQRSSLAAALLHDPDLLLLDEPTVGLDPVLRRAFWDHFRRLADSGKTLVISSHIMDEADRCDRLGFVRAGRLLITGSPAEIRARAGSDSLEEAFLTMAASRDEDSEVAA